MCEAPIHNVKFSDITSGTFFVRAGNSEIVWQKHGKEKAVNVQNRGTLVAIPANERVQRL